MSKINKKKCDCCLDLEKGLSAGPGIEIEENLIEEVIKHRNRTLNWANKFLKEKDPINRVCEEFLKDTIYQALVDTDERYNSSEGDIYYAINGKLHKAVISLVEVEKEELKQLKDWQKEVFSSNGLALAEDKELNYSLNEDNLSFETVTDYIEQLKKERDKLLEQSEVVLNDYRVETGSMQVLREIIQEVKNDN